MRRKLPNVSSPRGAPMGRVDVAATDVNAPHKLHLVRLRFVDGDYDEGGAYWGGGDGSSIYWAYGEDDQIQFEKFVRARSRAEARALVRETYPRARFYN
jgi:hypothetical protein